ncbi:hypothetical protein JMJ35_006600 [Cladonia borealis]|uniref:Uncharacterized protein n=1 Tax=Cladonia borealis TaxID=184061 RepID=A0AA39V0F4_9LECA|nr:hypothetical protein JMJ35_006600 [Cladonia borealis]
MTPLEITTASLTVANGVFSLAQNFWKLYGVEDDLKICLRLLGYITQDLQEARKLRNCKFQRLSSTDLKARVERAINDLEIAYNEISGSIEAIRVEKAIKDKISIAKRFVWVFKGKENFLAHQWAITVAHNRVRQEITSMQALPDVPLETMAPPAYEDVVLRSPSQRRALEGKNVAVIETKQLTTSAHTSPRSPRLVADGSIEMLGDVGQPQSILRSPAQLRALQGQSTDIIETKNGMCLVRPLPIYMLIVLTNLDRSTIQSGTTDLA